MSQCARLRNCRSAAPIGADEAAKTSERFNAVLETALPVAAAIANQRADARNPHQVVEQMKTSRIPRAQPQRLQAMAHVAAADCFVGGATHDGIRQTIK